MTKRKERVPPPGRGSVSKSPHKKIVDCFNYFDHIRLYPPENSI